MLKQPDYEIDDDLVARARVLGRGRWDIPRDGNPALFRHYRDRAAVADCSARDLLWRDAATADVSSPPDGALYWGYLHPGDPTVQSHDVAIAWAERHNARHPEHPVVTFWTSAGPGRLYAVNGLSQVQRDSLGFEWNFLIRVWESMSLRFAEETVGDVLVFGTYFHPGVILGRTELPALRRNPAVGADRIRFVHPPPERLSDGRVLTDDLRDVLARPGNQACIQFDDPAQPGYLDPAGAARLSYPELVEEVAARRAEVAEADRRWHPLVITPDSPAGFAWFPPGVDHLGHRTGGREEPSGSRVAAVHSAGGR